MSHATPSRQTGTDSRRDRCLMRRPPALFDYFSIAVAWEVFLGISSVYPEWNLSLYYTCIHVQNAVQ